MVGICIRVNEHILNVEKGRKVALLYPHLDWDIHNTWWLLGLLNCHNKEVTWKLESTVGVSTVCTDVLLLQEEV
jgi:hypothetical protein